MLVREGEVGNEEVQSSPDQNERRDNGVCCADYEHHYSNCIFCVIIKDVMSPHADSVLDQRDKENKLFAKSKERGGHDVVNVKNGLALQGGSESIPDLRGFKIREV